MSEPDPRISAAPSPGGQAPGPASADDSQEPVATERTPRYVVPSRDEEDNALEEFPPDRAPAVMFVGVPPEWRAATSAPDAREPWSRLPSRGPVLMVLGLLLAIAAQGAFITTRLLGEGRTPEATMHGAIVLDSRPSGADAFVDGRPAGRTPLRVRVWPGDHVTQLRRADGAVRQQHIRVWAGQTASQYIELGTVPPPPSRPAAKEGTTSAARAIERRRSPPPPGRVRIASHIPLLVFEGNDRIGSSDAGQLEFRGGTHRVTLVNERFGFRSQQTIEVAAGRTEELAIALPKGVLTANATPWAEVFVGGRSLGETPIGEAMLPLGHYNVVFRHPQLGERRVRVTIRADRPSIATVDFSD